MEKDFFARYSEKLAYRVDGLANCESEAISRIGAIQPFGFFLACHIDDLEVIAASENLSVLLGRPLDEIIGSDLSSLLRFDESSGAVSHDVVLKLISKGPRTIQLLGKTPLPGFTANFQRSNRHLCIDLEPIFEGDSGAYPVHYIQELVGRLNEHSELVDFSQVVVDQLRLLTGFDRVMVYRFLENWDGEVIAEAKLEKLESFLHLRYPSTDIPEQARRLYYDSKYRIIYDSNADVIPVQTIRGIAREEFDLSCTVLRASSPIHVKYLQNMGVRSSFSVPIKVHGKLWGLISCHHYDEPLRLSHEVRSACDLTSQMYAARIVDHVAKRRLIVKNHTLVVTQNLLRTVAEGQSPVEAFRVNEDAVLATTQSSGAYVRILGQSVALGECPPQDEIETLISHLKTNDVRGIWKVDSLKKEMKAKDGEVSAVGALAVPLSLGFEDFLIWFRPELSREIKWGGRPPEGGTKSVLEPRASFAAWAEQVRDHSAPWSEEDEESAQALLYNFVQGIFAKATALSRAYQELQRVGKAKDEFISLVSHELRTPLGIIIGWIDIMKDQPALNTELTEAIKVVDRNAKIQIGLINDLLDASRIISGKLQIDPQPGLNITQLVGEVVNSLQPTARAKDIELSWAKPPTTIVSGDADRLRQVVYNLITNALKFTPKHGRVSVGFETMNSNYSISVTDTGMGIEPQLLESIFDRFVQAGSAKSRQPGLGLGLSIVKAIVELHGGQAQAESMGLGHGAKFSILLPIFALSKPTQDEEEEVTSAGVERLEATTNLRGLKVLVAEDQPDSAEALRILLHRLGAEVVVVGDGARALEAVRDQKFDLILSDIGMPEMTGYEFLRAWRTLEAGRRVEKTPAIALTAYARSKDRAQALEAGFQNHIAKPVDRTELLALIRSVLSLEKAT